MKRERQEYWQRQLAEYWDSGLTVREYSELKDLSFESVRRWIRLLRAHPRPESAALELVEVTVPSSGGCGISLRSGGVDIFLEKGFDQATLQEVLKLLGGVACSASAVR